MHTYVCTSISPYLNVTKIYLFNPNIFQQNLFLWWIRVFSQWPLLLKWRQQTSPNFENVSLILFFALMTRLRLVYGNRWGTKEVQFCYHVPDERFSCLWRSHEVILRFIFTRDIYFYAWQTANNTISKSLDRVDWWLCLLSVQHPTSVLKWINNDA